jgi:hypothetical protein
MRARRQVASIAFCLLLLVCAAFVAPTVNPTPKATDLIDHWRRATIALGIVAKIGNVSKFAATGSAVIVALDEQYGCLLTAKHMVFDEPTGKNIPLLWMRLPSTAGKDEEPIALTLLDRQGRNLWKASPEGGDLVVIPLPWAELKGRNEDAVEISDFANPQNDVFEGANVIVLGYPQIAEEKYLSSPISRGGIVAWADPNDPSGTPFLVDANLYNGNSGGPVFLVRNGTDRYGNFSLGGGLAFLGIVSKAPLQPAPVVSAGGTVYRQNPISRVLNPEFAMVANVGGIGIIEPAARARKLIGSAFKNLPAR